MRDAAGPRLRLDASLPVRYVLVTIGVALGALLMLGVGQPVLAALLGAAALVGIVLGAHVATTRIVVEGGAEPTVEMGSAFGRRRAALSAIAVVRRRHMAGYGFAPLRAAHWELVGRDGRRLGRALDEGLSPRDVRAFEAELRNLGVPVDRD